MQGSACVDLFFPASRETRMEIQNLYELGGLVSEEGRRMKTRKSLYPPGEQHHLRNRFLGRRKTAEPRKEESRRIGGGSAFCSSSVLWTTPKKSGRRGTLVKGTDRTPLILYFLFDAKGYQQAEGSRD